VLGRSELSLEAYFQRLEGKDEVQMVCLDLASGDRALVKKHFPNARIAADRFHVIRIITTTSWPVGETSIPSAARTAAC
jgi:transposase